MLKYTEVEVCFAEIPDEIALCINISNCPCRCEGCHSSYLAEDIGTPLDKKELMNLIESNSGISCIALMGGDAEPMEVKQLAKFIKEEYPKLKVAWYSGREKLHYSVGLNIQDFDFIKLGPYREECGPLNKRTTNQKFYKVFHFSTGKCKLIDITHKFWKEND